MVPGIFSETTAVTDPTEIANLGQRALKLLMEYRDGRREPPKRIDDQRLFIAMKLASGEDLSENDFDMHRDILALESAPEGWGKAPSHRRLADFSAIVIGAGLQGTNAAVQLKRSGIPFTVLEKAGGPGGTWWQTKYPGARVDHPSRFYSHSYAGVNYPFEHNFAPAAETERYVNWVVDTYQVRPHMRFGVEVTAMEWRENDQKWRVRARTADGKTEEHTASVVISAIGLLERPKIPKLPGAENFKGRVTHSSRFVWSEEFKGKRVVVVGAGCTGAQLVPDIAAQVRELTVFQRTPGWIIPVPGYRDPMPQQEAWLNANVPFYANWTRFVLGCMLGDPALNKILEVDPTWPDPSSPNELNHRMRERLMAYLREKLKDRPDLIEKCTPDHPPFGSRPILDNGWFDTLLRPNVTLRREGVVGLDADSVISETGEHVAADLVVFATGYDPNDYFRDIDIRGRQGVSIQEVWAKDGPRAYWGIVVPKMPNLFIMYGPNANPRNLGPVQYGEWAMGYFLQCFKAMVESGWSSMEISESAYERFNEELNSRLTAFISQKYHKSGYYANARGRSVVQSPWFSAEVKRGLQRVVFPDYRVTPVHTDTLREHGT
jgi:4-hydroxyacetophenone monooxygenase